MADLNWQDVWLVAEILGEFEVRKFKATHHPEFKQWCIKVNHSMREMVDEDKVYRTEARAQERLAELLKEKA